MAIWNLGSINADLFYQVPHMPAQGETLSSLEFRRGLGGKGTNVSVAAARAAARVHHIGAVGADGAWATERLLEYGVDTRFIALSEKPTGHAIILTDPSGENQIVLHGGANHAIETETIQAALSGAAAGDWFVCQNETNGQEDAMRLAQQLAQKIAYVAAPFDAQAVNLVLPYIDLLVLNQVEAQQLETALSKRIADLPVQDILVTRGAQGCVWYHQAEPTEFDAFEVQAVDSTGAGDTFAGFVLAGLDRGQPMAQAIRTAQIAAAIMVTRYGTADVIPDLKDIEDLRS